jgi:hypothetical protein
MELTVSLQQAEEPIAIMQVKDDIVGVVHALGRGADGAVQCD